MALTLNQLRNKTKTIKIFEGTEDEFSISYRLDYYTKEVEDLFSEKADDGKTLSHNIKILSSLIVSWDVIDEETKEVTKPTLDILDTLGSTAISAMINGIMGESVPNSTTVDSQSAI